MVGGAVRSHDRDWALDYSIAELRLSLAFIALRLLDIKAGFRADQPRGCDGRWCGGSGSLTVVRKDRTGDPRIDAKTDEILDVLKEVVESTEPGEGFSYGIRIHSNLAERLRELDLPGIGKHGVEQSSSPATWSATVFPETYARMFFSGMVEPAWLPLWRSGTSRPDRRDCLPVAFGP